MPCGRRVTQSASQQRLEQLITERLKPGADKPAIDKRIWDLLGETWAVMYTDLSGFSRRVAEFGITHFLQTIYESMRIFIPCIEGHDGILLKAEADSLLVIFRRPERAMACALAMQREAEVYNRNMVPEEQILLCVGLGYGPMLRIGDEDVFGAEVNAASKLGEDTAKTWEILVTENFRDNIPDAAAEGLRFDRLPVVPSGAAVAYSVAYRRPSAE
jgi:class 3 adenylate cyclase